MQFTGYLSLKDKTVKDLVRTFREYVGIGTNGWLVEDIDVDAAIHCLEQEETNLTREAFNEIIGICNTAIETTHDVIVKKPHWEIVRTWLLNRMP